MGYPKAVGSGRIAGISGQGLAGIMMRMSRATKRERCVRERTVGWWCARAAWLGLVFLHVQGVASTWSQFAGPSLDVLALLRCVAMASATVFFVLKIVDVPVLRFRPGWRSPVVFTLVVLLMHLGVIDRAMQSQHLFAGSGSLAGWLVAIVASSAAGVVLLGFVALRFAFPSVARATTTHAAELRCFVVRWLDLARVPVACSRAIPVSVRRGPPSSHS
jgi:hypothetical protein